jgi:hypothetical protein
MYFIEQSSASAGTAMNGLESKNCCLKAYLKRSPAPRRGIKKVARRGTSGTGGKHFRAEGAAELSVRPFRARTGRVGDQTLHVWLPSCYVFRVLNDCNDFSDTLLIEPEWHLG